MLLMFPTGFITCISLCTVADAGFQILEGDVCYLQAFLQRPHPSFGRVQPSSTDLLQISAQKIIRVCTAVRFRAASVAYCDGDPYISISVGFTHLDLINDVLAPGCYMPYQTCIRGNTSPPRHHTPDSPPQQSAHLSSQPISERSHHDSSKGLLSTILDIIGRINPHVDTQ